MKNKDLYIKKAIFCLIVLYIMVPSCKEEPVGQTPLDGMAPGMVTNVNVENTPGGAKLTYELPDDEDLLYVKAVYQLNDDEPSESKASIYSNTLEIEGFGDTTKREILVYAVDRSQNESEPVAVEVSPQEPPIVTIGKTLTMAQDFGGVKVTWENPTEAEIAIVILTEDNNMEYAVTERFYSSIVEGKGSVIGMDTISYNWQAYVQDKWENTSEPLYDTITPLYEVEFDNSLFEAIDLPGDVSAFSGWGKEKMWNDVWAIDEGFSSPGGTGVWPQSVTVDLGTLGKISRFRLYQRMGSYTWAEGNPRYFQIYGCPELDASGDWGSWTLLMDCESIKPSGEPIGTNTDEDIEVATNGEDFYNDASNPAVRYIRILVTQTWAGGDNFQITEFKIYGDNRF